MIALSITAKKEKQLSKLLKDNGKKVRQQIAIAVNATTKKTVSTWAKSVGNEIATAQKNIKATIEISKKASASQGKSPTAVVRQKKTGRISLRDFKGRQGATGVSYRIKKSGGRGFVQSAFQGPRPGKVSPKWKGRVFKRVGKARNPIIPLFGPSPWGVTTKKKLKKPITKETKAELVKQIERRIRFLKLKQSGAI